MIANIALLQQIMIFVFYAIFSFGVTSLINFLFKLKRGLSFILPGLLLVASVVLVILGITSPYLHDLGFLKYSLLVFFSFIGSLIASLVYCFARK